MSKKFLVALSIVALGCGWCASSLAADAEKAKSSLSVQFKGRIIDAGCELSTDAQGNAVHLGTYPTQYFRQYRSRVESDHVPFELIIRRCHLVDGDQKAKNESDEALPIDRIKLTFTDDGVTSSNREHDAILYAPDEKESLAKNIGVLVEYKNLSNRFENVFGNEPSKDISLSGMQYTAHANHGSPEYRIPFRACMAATGTGPVTQGSVQGQMTVTLTYE